MTLIRTLIFVCMLCLPIRLQAAEPSVPVEDVVVTLDADTSLRALAERYFGDPNAWPEILRANALTSADQARPGMRLSIPVVAMRELARNLVELRQLIYQATEAGALIFARERIEEAMAHQAGAWKARREALPSKAQRLAEEGIVAARAALETSRANRDAAAQAIVGSAHGRVERRRSNALDWSRIAVDTLLAERERLRTLSASFAVVCFRDASSIHMTENAHLVIRRLRQDRLTRREEVDVVLHGGDVRALMGADASRQVLRVVTPGIETQGQSRDYWVSKTPESTRLSNFEGELEISAEGASVTLARNQGTLVEPQRPPLAPIDLLESPMLAAPQNGQRIYERLVALRWSEVSGAEVYWVEVARDPEFTQLSLTRTDVAGTGHDLRLADVGIYYWRVSSIDAFGLPGPAAPAGYFRMSRDATPPYLRVISPANGLHVLDPQIQVEGQTETGAVLFVNGTSVAVETDGRYRQTLTLTPGTNRLSFEARDRAGNLHQVERLVYLTPDTDFPLELARSAPRDDAGRLLVNRSWFALEGTTLPGTSLRVSAAAPEEFAASGVADARGRFSLTLPARTRITTFELAAHGPLGQRRRETFDVVLDQTPPVIKLDRVPAERAAEPRLTLTGQLEGGETLLSAGREVALSPDGRFSLDIVLESGANVLSLTARDRAGNRGSWQQTIVLDQEPPRLTGYRLVEETHGARPTLTVEIKADDASGLVAGAPYRVEAGSFVHQGVAQRCPDRSCYRDRFILPAEEIVRARLSAVTLQDYLGNRQEVALD